MRGAARALRQAALAPRRDTPRTVPRARDSVRTTLRCMVNPMLALRVVRGNGW